MCHLSPSAEPPEPHHPTACCKPVPRRTIYHPPSLRPAAPGGLSLAGVDLRRAASRDEFAAAVAATAEKLGPEEWVLGGFWDGEAWGRAMDGGLIL